MRTNKPGLQVLVHKHIIPAGPRITQMSSMWHSEQHKQLASVAVPIKLKAVAVLRDHAVHRQQRAPHYLLNLAEQAVRSVVAQCRGEADAQTGKRTHSMSVIPSLLDCCRFQSHESHSSAKVYQ